MSINETKTPISGQDPTVTDPVSYEAFESRRIEDSMSSIAAIFPEFVPTLEEAKYAFDAMLVVVREDPVIRSSIRVLNHVDVFNGLPSLEQERLLAETEERGSKYIRLDVSSQRPTLLVDLAKSRYQSEAESTIARVIVAVQNNKAAQGSSTIDEAIQNTRRTLALILTRPGNLRNDLVTGYFYVRDKLMYVDSLGGTDLVFGFREMLRTATYGERDKVIAEIEKTALMLAALDDPNSGATADVRKNIQKLYAGIRSYAREWGADSEIISVLASVNGTIPVPTEKLKARSGHYFEDNSNVTDYLRQIKFLHSNVGVKKGKKADYEYEVALREGMDLILTTISFVGKKFNLPNGEKLIEAIQKGRVSPRPDSMAKQLPLSAPIDLANSVTAVINRSIKDPNKQLKNIPMDFGNLSEAFRRLMFVVFNGEEVDDERAEEVALETRFQAIDSLVELVNARFVKEKGIGKVALRGGTRGQIPSTGHIFWNKWRPGYGMVG